MASIRNRIKIPLEIAKGERTICNFVTFNNLSDAGEHFAIVFDLPKLDEVPSVRVHSECITGDLFGSLKCDCGPQLKDALSFFKNNGGILLYLRQEGRGIGLKNKLDAYALQEQGHDTFEANVILGYPEDKRSFEIAAEMLLALDTTKIKLITNNPNKIKALRSNRIICEQVIRPAFLGDDNRKYLHTKKDKAMHDLMIL